MTVPSALLHLCTCAPAGAAVTVNPLSGLSTHQNVKSKEEKILSNVRLQVLFVKRRKSLCHHFLEHMCV